jgi:alpha-glucosidase
MQALTGARTDRLSGRDWWRGAVGYEVYVRSFADANGDGVGDLAGVTSKLEYLADLGIDVVWLTPFFPSPGHDHGYDVADYRDVNPMHGTLDDWDAMVDEARRLGIRLFVDIVPNHTSNAHPWFVAAVNDPTGPFRDYYVWADPAADGGPPNNWVSHFGGPAWSLDPGGSGKYYCHLFLPEQPDLNWANPAVTEEFCDILRFWSQRGADGFRIDVAHALTKDPQLRSNPLIREITPGMEPHEIFASYDHVYDLHRSETALLFRHWRTAVEPYGGVLLGEMDTRDVHRFAEYVADGTALHAGFVLQLGLRGWRPARIIDTLVEYQTHANGGSAWEVSNHDQARATSRFGGGTQGLRRTMALTALMMAFDGIVFLYEGEELGLPDAQLLGPPEDPASARNGEGVWTRDVARGPMPWTSGANNGFTTAPQAWLPTATVPDELTASAQVGDPDSTFARYREMTLLRKQHTSLWQEPAEIERHDEVVVVRRGSVVTIGNLSASEFTWHAGNDVTVVYESGAASARTDGDALVISPESTVVVRFG